MRLKFRCLLLLLIAFCAVATASAQTADDLTRPLQVSSDGHFLVQPNGQPFFWLADTAWNLFRALTIEEADLYFRDRAAKGFNAIQVAAIFGGYGTGDALTKPNRYGETPFIR